MKVKILEEKLSSHGFLLMKDDSVTVPDSVGAEWCRYGWAEDVSGTVKTGMRNVNPVTIQPKNLTNPVKGKVA